MHWYDGPWPRFDARVLGRDFRLPMFVFQGNDDDGSPADLGEPYANWIRAH